jgi:hypothetical protein
MTQRYEVQTKFIYGFENVWRDEDGKHMVCIWRRISSS